MILPNSPAFKRLFKRARKRLEREPDALERASVQLRDPTDTERAGIEGLLGRRFRGTTLSMALAEVDHALIGGTGKGLRDWLTTQRPLRDRPAEAAVRAARLEALLGSVGQSPLAAEPWFVAWLDSLDRGALTRLHGEGALDRVLAAVAILEALPAPQVPIALFATQHAGGTKALDDTPLERLVLHALALRSSADSPTNAEQRRALWERFGVVPDDLTTTVLVLNLPVEGDDFLAQTLRGAATLGIPVRVTLHQLVRFSPTLRSDQVFVCENPAILRMAAERLAARSAPLIATEGRANSAFWCLLDQVPGQVFVRADFDKEGLEIAAATLQRCNGRPWRFDRATFERFKGQNKLVGNSLPPTPWDPGLAEAMRGQPRVEEEQLVDLLLDDLANSGAGGPHAP